MQVKNSDMKAMKSEDARYGENVRKPQLKTHQKAKNPINFARMSPRQLMMLGDDEDDEILDDEQE